MLTVHNQHKRETAEEMMHVHDVGIVDHIRSDANEERERFLCFSAFSVAHTGVLFRSLIFQGTALLRNTAP